MPLPRWIEPQLSKLATKAPSGAQWVHEIKLDGYRMAARIEDGRVKLLTRSGLDWTAKYLATGAALAKLKVTTAYLDGELCGVRPDAVTSFELMQQDGDLTRRALIARLDPKTDRPELRQFDYDPVVDATEHRGELVAAALTILKAYCVAGMPGRPAKLQGFAEWSDLVRGALMWVGLEDPAATQERLRENDPKLTRLIRIATVWRDAFGAYATTVAEAVSKAEEKKRVEVSWDFKTEPVNPDLLDAFLAVARRGAAINPVALGAYLGSEAERVVALEKGAKVRFMRVGKRGGVVVWSLATVVAGEAEADGDEVRY